MGFLDWCRWRQVSLEEMSMTASATTTILVPGAWMGSWIWEPTVQRLQSRGIDAETLTLRGLLAGEHPLDVAAVRLEDHVRQLLDQVERYGDRPVVLVSHSYSAMVTASAADRLGAQVRGLIHIGGFVPTDGRSMLDAWGESDQERAQERAEIEEADHLWPAPTLEILAHEADLSPADREFLAARFTPHPGRTITDPAQLAVPVADQPSTYVALTPSGGLEEAWKEAPPVARAASAWRRRYLVSGHWPMVSALDATVDLLEDEIRRYDQDGT